MTTMEPAPRQVAVKVSPEGDRLITSGAHYLRMSKKDLVEAAVEFYLNARREEMQAGMRELPSQLDGSSAPTLTWGFVAPGHFYAPDLSPCFARVFGPGPSGLVTSGPVCRKS
jgi:hypothetical protein